jgi:hypothetical protein
MLKIGRRRADRADHRRVEETAGTGKKREQREPGCKLEAD